VGVIRSWGSLGVWVSNETRKTSVKNNHGCSTLQDYIAHCSLHNKIYDIDFYTVLHRSVNHYSNATEIHTDTTCVHALWHDFANVPSQPPAM